MLAFGPTGLSAVQAAIEKLDPEGRYVVLDVAARIVRYSEEFQSTEVISEYVGEEEPARAYILCWLCVIGGYLPANIVLEKRYSIGRPKTGAELDILVQRPDGTTYALIEIKSPAEYDIDQDKYIKGQLFDLALHEPGVEVLSYATVSATGSDVYIHAKAIDYKVFGDFEAWRLSRACGSAIPVTYGEPEHVHLVSGGPRDLRTGLTLPEMRRIQKRLHDVLWRGSTPDNTIYGYIVKLFLAKTYDEKTVNVGQEYAFQIKYVSNKRESPGATFIRMSDLYKTAYRKYMSLGAGDPVEGLNERDFSAEQAAFVVELLQDVSLIRSAQDSDVLGAFFEGITREGFKQSKGLFFTHSNVVQFLIRVLGLDSLVAAKVQSDALASDKLPYIIDPSCGSGSFLLASMKYVTDYVSSNRASLSVNHDTRDFLNSNFVAGQENAWAANFLYGIDAGEILALSTKVNMLLRQDGQTHIYHDDGLAPLSSYRETRFRGRPHQDVSVYSKLVAESFDVVISNPPFSITLDPHTIASLEKSFELCREVNSESLFLERWYQLLKPKGRLGVVLPESFFSTRENLGARLFLFAHFNIKAVVSLPKEAFEPWTPTRTSLLFAEKKTLDEERVWKSQIVRREARGVRARNFATRRIRAVNACFPMVDGSAIALLCSKALAASGDARSLSELTLPQLDSALGGFSTGGASLTPAEGKLVGRVRAAVEALDVLDRTSRFFGLDVVSLVGLPVSELEAAVQRMLVSMRRLDLRVWALQTAGSALPLEFVATGAESIGYRRTKRGENERPNDLFHAETVPAAGGAKRRVYDVDLTGSEQWRIDDANSGSLLGLLRAAITWSTP